MKENNLKPFYGTAFQWLIYTGKSREESVKILVEKGLYENTEILQDWGEWHLILNGKKYYSKFKSYDEWYNHYN